MTYDLFYGYTDASPLKIWGLPRKQILFSVFYFALIWRLKKEFFGRLVVIFFSLSFSFRVRNKQQLKFGPGVSELSRPRLHARPIIFIGSARGQKRAATAARSRRRVMYLVDLCIKCNASKAGTDAKPPSTYTTWNTTGTWGAIIVRKIVRKRTGKCSSSCILHRRGYVANLCARWCSTSKVFLCFVRKTSRRAARGVIHHETCRIVTGSP